MEEGGAQLEESAVPEAEATSVGPYREVAP